VSDINVKINGGVIGVILAFVLIGIGIYYGKQYYDNNNIDTNTDQYPIGSQSQPYLTPVSTQQPSNRVPSGTVFQIEGTVIGKSVSIKTVGKQQTTEASLIVRDNKTGKTIEIHDTNLAKQYENGDAIKITVPISPKSN
jgi:hypothetical protein